MSSTRVSPGNYHRCKGNIVASERVSWVSGLWRGTPLDPALKLPDIIFQASLERPRLLSRQLHFGFKPLKTELVGDPGKNGGPAYRIGRCTEAPLQVLTELYSLAADLPIDGCGSDHCQEHDDPHNVRDGQTHRDPQFGKYSEPSEHCPNVRGSDLFTCEFRRRSWDDELVHGCHRSVNVPQVLHFLWGYS